MAKELKVDPDALNNAARVFRGLTATLDGPRDGLSQVTLVIGDFADGNALKKTIEAGIKDFETALTVLNSVFVKIDGHLVSASTILTDADESNDGWVVTDLNSIPGH